MSVYIIYTLAADLNHAYICNLVADCVNSLYLGRPILVPIYEIILPSTGIYILATRPHCKGYKNIKMALPSFLYPNHHIQRHNCLCGSHGSPLVVFQQATTPDWLCRHAAIMQQSGCYVRVCRQQDSKQSDLYLICPLNVPH